MSTLYAPGTTVQVPRFITTLDPTQTQVTHILLVYQLILPDGVTSLPAALWEWTIPGGDQGYINYQGQVVVADVAAVAGIGTANLATGTAVRVTATTTYLDPTSVGGSTVLSLTPEYQLVLPDGTALPTQTWDLPLDSSGQAYVSSLATTIIAALLSFLGANVSQWQPPTAPTVQLALSGSIDAVLWTEVLPPVALALTGESDAAMWASTFTPLPLTGESDAIATASA